MEDATATVASWSESVENAQWFHHSSKHWSYWKGNQMEDASWSENVENVQWSHQSSEHWSYLKGNKTDDANSVTGLKMCKMCNDLTIHQNTGVT